MGIQIQYDGGTDNQSIPQPTWAYCEIPNYTGARVREDDPEMTVLCTSYGFQRGDLIYRPPVGMVVNPVVFTLLTTNCAVIVFRGNLDTSSWASLAYPFCKPLTNAGSCPLLSTIKYTDKWKQKFVCIAVSRTIISAVTWRSVSQRN